MQKKQDDNVEFYKSKSRELALLFLYQANADKIHYYSKHHLNAFLTHHAASEKVIAYSTIILQDFYKNHDIIDNNIDSASKNWSLSRMPIIDLIIIRLAITEIMTKKTPYGVVVNEYVELAKKFGDINSFSFVNAIIETIVKKIE